MLGITVSYPLDFILSLRLLIMQSLTPIFPPRFQGEIHLPASKSLSNRVLILTALAGGIGRVKGVSDCDDTLTMERALNERAETIDVGAAGTAMRFLTAYFAIQPNENHLLTGTERMKNRPIGLLVDALRRLGADIAYLENEGFPPIYIKGCELNGGVIALPADVSSQYVSALLMVAPYIRNGLTLRLTGKVLSRPYIDMTLALMDCFGAKIYRDDDRTIRVSPCPYQAKTGFAIESDWSAASYWYEMAALAPDRELRITLSCLFADSLQGDSRVSLLYRPLGVRTTFDRARGKAILTRSERDILPPESVYELNLGDTPDLAQALTVTCALLRRPFRFTGLKSLRIKETDRLEALRRELQRFGVSLRIEDDDTIAVLNYPSLPIYNGSPVLTYNDHRMAMAFAPVALRFPAVKIDNPEVVMKSYPRFWDDLSSLNR